MGETLNIENMPNFGDVVVTGKAVYVAEYVRDDRNPADTYPQKKTGNNKWYKWGDDDLAPNAIYNTAYKNDLMPVIIERKASLISGLGVSLYINAKNDKGSFERKTVALEDYPEIFDFFQENEIDLYLHQRALHLETFANAFTSFFTGSAGVFKNKIVRLKNEHVQGVRCGFYEDYTSISKGQISLVKNYFLSGDFVKAKRNPKKGVDPNNTSSSDYIEVASAELDLKDALANGRCLLHTKYPQSGQDYYSYPNWYFGLQDWISLASKIATFQNANIDNAMYAKQLVVIPEAVITSRAKVKNTTDLAAVRKEIVDEIEKNLSGGKNAGKTISVVQYNNGGAKERLELVPITNNNNDTLFLQTYDTCTRVISRSLGISPILAGLHLDGSQGSGSEIKYLYNYEVQVAEPKRRLLLRDLEFVKKVNKWPKEVHFQIENAKMVDTADNKQGVDNAIKVK